MRKVLFIVCAAFLAAGCNNKAETTETKSPDSTNKVAESRADELVYPYKLDEPYNDWQPGDKKHGVTAMKALKGFETNNIAESVSYFGDSVDLHLDNFRQKVSRDSLAALFTTWRNDFTSMTIKLQDWESVVSKDGKEEWVTLWYKQTWTDKKGKTDSLAEVDDLKIKNGKIIVLDEKVQHFPAKK